MQKACIRVDVDFHNYNNYDTGITRLTCLRVHICTTTAALFC